VSHNTLLVFEVTILVLAIFLGFEVISKVPTLLHTPLMSGTNAIHGIVVVGAMLVLGAWAWLRLPADAQVPIHWGVDGQPNGYAPKTIGPFLVPLIAIAAVVLGHRGRLTPAILLAVLPALIGVAATIAFAIGVAIYGF